MAKVALLLSGCGVEDGSEVYESVLAILAVQRAGSQVFAVAPDIKQAEIIDHYTGKEERSARDGGGITRNVLAEAARIVRGKIVSLTEVSAHDFDALIIPGGFGVVKNLCSFATDGERAVVDKDVQKLIREMAALKKPIGACCIAPVLVALCLRESAPSLTIGNDGSVALSLQRIGATHTETGVNDIHIDEKNNLVSTAAFMLAKHVAEAEVGITKMVNEVLNRVGVTD